MTDHDNADDADGQNSKLSRRTALGLMGASAVGGAAASSAYSELTAERPIDVEVTDDQPDVVVSQTGNSELEITNHTDNPVDAEVTTADGTEEDVVLVESSGSDDVSEENSTWTVEGISSDETATLAFEEQHESRDDSNSTVEFDVSAFSDTAGFSIDVSSPVDLLYPTYSVREYRHIGFRDDDLYMVDSEGNEEWDFNTGDDIDGSPAVVDGIVYTASKSGTVYAVDLEDGSEVWSESPFDESQSSVVVVDGVVYCGHAEGLVALRADNGDEVWDTEDVADVRGAPAVVDGTVYVGDDEGTLHALDADTGEEEWTFSDADEIYASVAVVDGSVYVPDRDDELYALDADADDDTSDADRVEWSIELDGDIRSTPAVVDGTVYIGTEGDTLYALDAETDDDDERIEWTFDADGRFIFNSPTVVDGTLYIGNEEDLLYAIDIEVDEEDLDQGETREKWRYEGFSDRPLPGAAVVDGVVHIAEDTGRLHAVDDNGDDVWVSNLASDRAWHSMPVGGADGWSEANMPGRIGNTDPIPPFPSSDSDSDAEISSTGLVHQYDARDDDTLVQSNGAVDEWQDATSSTDLTTGTANGLSTINDVQAVEFTEDELVAAEGAPSLDGEYTLWAVLDPATFDENSRHPFYVSEDDVGVRLSVGEEDGENVIGVTNSGEAGLNDMTVDSTPFVFGVRYSDSEGWETRLITESADDTETGDDTGFADPEGDDMGVGRHGEQGDADYDGLAGQYLLYDERQADDDWDQNASALSDIWL